MAFNIKEQWKQINKDTDKVLWIIVILLAIFSILAVFSTSNKLNVAGSSFLFLLSEHIVYVLLGIGLMFVLQKFPPYKAYGIHGRFFLILAMNSRRILKYPSVPFSVTKSVILSTRNKSK